MSEETKKPVNKTARLIGNIIGGILLGLAGIASVISLIIISKGLYYAFKWAITFTIGG